MQMYRNYNEWIHACIHECVSFYCLQPSFMDIWFEVGAMELFCVSECLRVFATRAVCVIPIDKWLGLLEFAPRIRKPNLFEFQ